MSSRNELIDDVIVIQEGGLSFPICICRAHNKRWMEGDTYDTHGGKACAECCEKAKSTYTVSSLSAQEGWTVASASSTAFTLSEMQQQFAQAQQRVEQQAYLAQEINRSQLMAAISAQNRERDRQLAMLRQRR